MNIGELSKLFLIYNQAKGIKEPVTLTKGQQEIFNCIIQRSPARVHVMTPTQLGKSFVCALAVLLRAMTYPEKWAIVAPSEAKAQVIMRYVIEHIFDNELFVAQLDTNDSTERLKRERSKKRITFKRGGEIFVLSADSQNKQNAGETLMGFGAANIILDESCLIDDDIYAKIKRMLGGHSDNFLLEIGNPFNRNHFLRSYRNSDYKVIEIDWKRAVDEKRETFGDKVADQYQKFVDEMRKEAFFDVMYEVKFPPENAIDIDGWTQMVTESDLRLAFEVENPAEFGEKKLGVDIARSGGNFNVWVLRSANYARVVAKTTTDNLMDIIGLTSEIMQKYDVEPENTFIDATGMGAGVYDRFREKGIRIQGVNLSSSADEKEKYANKRAEIYFRLREWLKRGGHLEKAKDFFQLTDIKYKLRSTGTLKIIDKAELRRKGIPSPDVADALALTFSELEVNNALERRNVLMKQSKQVTYA